MKKCSPYQNHVHESACSHIIMDTELYIELYVVKNMVVFQEFSSVLLKRQNPLQTPLLIP